MSIYGQYCPISRAMDLLGERWTLLVIRELLMGSSRFNELQRGLSKMSPSLLTKRLRELEDANVIFKKKINGQKGYEYFLTSSGKALESIVMALGQWGLDWMEQQFSEDELDLEYLMQNIARQLEATSPSNSQTVLKFYFSDATEFKDWWLVMDSNKIDLCTKDPGNEPDAYITTTSRCMIDIWMLNHSWKHALTQGDIKLSGTPSVCKQLPDWIGSSNITRQLKENSPRTTTHRL